MSFSTLLMVQTASGGGGGGGGPIDTISLESHYKLNGDGADAYGTSPGTVDGAVAATDRFSNASGAMSFAGTQSVYSTLDFASTDRFTIAGWVWFDSLFYGEPLVGQRDLTGTWACYVRGYSIGFTISGEGDFNSGTLDFSIGTWIHFGFVVVPHNIKAYVNGILRMNQVTIGAPYLNASVPFMMGKSGYSYISGGLQGRLDDISVYSIDKSDAEMAALYADTVSTPVVF